MTARATREGAQIRVNGASYVLSRQLADDPPTHAMMNLETRFALVMGRFYPPGASPATQPDAYVLASDVDVIEVVPNTLIAPTDLDAPWFDDLLAAEHLLEKSPVDGGTVQRHLERVLDQTPSNPLALRALGNLFAAIGDLENRCITLGRLVALEPNYEPYRRAIVRTYASPVLYAIHFADAFETYLRMYPRSTMLDEVAVAAMLRHGEPETARRLLELRQQSTNPQPKALKGLMARLRGIAAPRNARTDLQARVDDAFERKAQASKFVARAKSANPDEAARLLESTLKIYPEAIEAEANLGLCLARLGQFRDAVSHLCKASDLLPEPGRTVAGMNMVFCLIREGHFDAITLVESTLSTMIEGDETGEARDELAVRLPGVASWIDGNEIHEERPASALALLDEAIQHSDDISDFVRQVRALYARAVELV